ncbi:MAG TPA: hypothetical protein VF230_06120 [Acidimicrobiales bacterium]
MTRDDTGQVGGFEGVTFGTLVFVIGVLVVANAWGVVDAKLAATAAAREATRAFVESDGPTSADALAHAEDAARAAIVGHGRSVARMELEPEAAVLERCSRVTIAVRYRVPLVSIPLLGRFGRGFVTTGRHSEIVDPFRSGLAGTSRCAA